jgi:hypothetical protein
VFKDVKVWLLTFTESTDPGCQLNAAWNNIQATFSGDSSYLASESLPAAGLEMLT